MEPTTLDDKLRAALQAYGDGDIFIQEAVTHIKLALSEHLPETYDEQGMGKDAQQYLSELEKLLQ